VDGDQIDKLAAGRTGLKGQTLDLGRFERRPGEVLLRSDIIGRHLVDMAAGSIVQAHDLALAFVSGRWRLVGVLRRSRSAVRRFMPGASRVLRPQTDQLLDWKDVQPFVGHVPTAKLKMPALRLRRLHPAQIADLVEHSTHEEGEEIIEAVEGDAELTADVFEELDTKHQLEFLRSESNEEAAQLLSRMAPDDAADLLLELDQERRLPILNLMPSPQQHRLRALLQYNPTTAGGMMSPEYVAVPRGATAGQALDRVRAASAPHQLLTMVFIVEADGRLVGSVPAVDLIRADPGTAVEAMPGMVTPSVHVADDIEDVTVLMADYNLSALAVTDDADMLIGAISVDDLLEALLPQEWRRRADVSGGN
jgi:Mg/Co/Ni transporter MgtE